MTYQRKIRTIQHLAIFGLLLLILPSLNLDGGNGDLPLIIATPLLKPLYTVPNLQQFTLKQLYDLTLGKVKPIEVYENMQPVLVNSDRRLTLAQILPLLQIYRESRQGFSEIIQTIFHAIYCLSTHENAYIKLFIIGSSFYIYKSGRDYLLISHHWPLNWPWLPFQLTWLMQQLWPLFHAPENHRDLQLVWWWFGEPIVRVSPPIQLSLSFKTFNPEARRWSPEKKIFPFLLKNFISLTNTELEGGLKFINEIQDLYLKLERSHPDYYTVATHPFHILHLELSYNNLYWQAYVGEPKNPLETPSEILERLTHYNTDRKGIFIGAVFPWTKRYRSVYQLDYRFLPTQWWQDHDYTLS